MKKVHFAFKLPSRQNGKKPGLSKVSVKKRCLHVYKKLQQHTQMHKQYSDFIHEFLAIHKEYLTMSQTVKQNEYLIIGVHKNDSTTQLILVFDANAISTKGITLNYWLLVG